MEIRDVMTAHPGACNLEQSANDAAKIMWERDCGAVPVTDDAGAVRGIVTDRDVCMAAYFQGRALSDIRLADIMTAQPATCTDDIDLAAAERLMRERQIRRLPIVDRRGALVGMLSLADVVRSAKTNGSHVTRPGEISDLVQTVTAVSEPRRT